MSDNLLSSISRYTDREAGWRSKLMSELRVRSGKITDLANESNNNISRVVGSFAEGVSDIRARINTIANMYLTISTISGNSNTEYPLTKMPVLDSRNILILGDRISLKTKTKTLAAIVDVDVYTNGTYGNLSDFDTIRAADKESIVSDSPFEVERIDSPVSATYSITLSERTLINKITFNFKEFGVKGPDVDSIEISVDGKSFKRVPFDSYQDGSTVHINIDSVHISSIRISLSKSRAYISDLNKTRYAIGISNLSAGVETAEEDGQIVFGPLDSPDEVLKASIAASIPSDGYSFDNIQFEISHDRQNWQRVSVPFSVSEYPKHIDYNNVSEESVRTQNPVKNLFVRLTMAGSKANKGYTNDRVNRHYQVLTTNSYTLFTPFDLSDKYIVGAQKGLQYGSRVSIDNYVDDVTEEDRIISYKSGESYQIKSFASAGEIRKATVRTSMHKCHVHPGEAYRLIPKYDMDISTVEAYKISNPIRRKVRASESEGVVIPFQEEAGVYILTDGEISRRIDLTEGFFSSCYQWTYRPHNKSVSLLSPTGRRLKTFEAGAPINLLDYFTFPTPISDPSSGDIISFNHNYPLAELKENEFTVIDNSIYTVKTQAVVNCDIVLKEKIDIKFGVNINSAYIYTDDAKFSKRSERLSNYDGLKSAKLSKSGLLKGSVKITNKESSLVSFIKEVPYVDGISEFNTGARLEIAVPKSRQEFSLGRLVDHFSVFDVIGYTEVFKSKVFSKEELLFKGDYMLEDRGNETFIILPDNVKTHDIIDTRISLDVSISNASNGFFSVDYANGIIYSQSVISGTTEVEYVYSNIFLSGQPISVLDKTSYTGSGRQIQVSKPIDKAGYVVLSPAKESVSEQILKAPRLRGLTLNTVTTQ